MSFENVLINSKEYKILSDSIDRCIVPVNAVTGTQAQKAHLIYTLYKDKNKDVLVICT